MNTKWYVLQTGIGQEETAAGLLRSKVSHELWEACRILKKQQLFRIKGQYILNCKELFPGYLFVRSSKPKELAETLHRSSDFPQPVGSSEQPLVPVKEEDMQFLQSVCGYSLEHEMPLSTVTVDEEGKIQTVSGVLSPYLEQISRQRLRHRYVTAGVRLFDRQADILFGICMAGDDIRERVGA